MGYDARLSSLVDIGPGLVVCEPFAGYRPRDPEENVLHGVVAAQLETFLARQRRRDRPVPRFVERELRSFLECGVLAHGFLRVHCDACGEDRVVAFSCKGRGFCASCGGRRMADTAAHLVDRVLPEVPIRQWVLSLPFGLRYRLAYDASLVRDVLQIFVAAVFGSLRGRARADTGLRQTQCGAVTFVQRFGGALNLNVHFHSLVLDGVYAADEKRDVRFHPLPPPDDAEVARVTGRVSRRILALLERRALGPQADPDEADPLRRDQPLLAELYGASVHGRIATGPRAGLRVSTVGDGVEVETLIPGSPRCASVSGINVHANVCVAPGDRRRLERLCRYCARPAVATERLSLLPDGRVLYRLKHPWRDGSTHMLFEPVELVAKLAALVPPPRFNLVRNHGVLAPAARSRPQIVPASPSAEADRSPHPGCRARPATGGNSRPLETADPPCNSRSQAGKSRNPREQPSRPRPRNYCWAELMRRVWDIDVLECPRCFRRMRIVAAIHPPEAVRAILDCLGLPSRAPPIAGPAEQ